MGFKWKNTSQYNVPSRITHIPATSGETYTAGEALTIVNGAWTKAANGVAIGGFSAQSKTTSASDLALEVIEARSGDRFEVGYTGTPAAGFAIGQTAADVSTDGLTVLSSDVTGGALAVLDINTTKLTCVVQVKNRIFS